METRPVRLRQLVDWRAAVIAGIVSGILLLLVHILLAGLVLGAPFIPLRMLAAFALGDSALPPPPSFDPAISLVALAVVLVASVLLACLLAIIIHRWGMLVGIVGGALYGAALYFILFYGVSASFPWLYPLRNWMTFASLVVFGLAAGGIYEALEVETFVPETS